MSKAKVYTEEEVRHMLYKTVGMMLDLNLENSIAADSQEGELLMGNRIKQRATVNGKTFWITGSTNQDVLDAYLDLCIREGAVAPAIVKATKPQMPLFGDYLDNFVRVFKSDQEALTMAGRKQIIRKHIKPRFGMTQIDKITVTALQEWLNDLAKTYAKETLLKICNTMRPALDSAVEDGYIKRNPLKSSRITIGGKDSVGHKAIPKFKMEVVRHGITSLPERERRLAALLSTTGMRFEEILGLQWEDIDFADGWISIRRAVVHPDRNKPIIKTPKTKTSTREIPIPPSLKVQLAPIEKSGFLLHNANGDPLSYTEARRSFEKIRKAFDLQGYSAHDFRDTCATEWRESGIPMDIIARMLGHSKTDVTERKYVNYREAIYDGIRNVMSASM